MKKFKLIGYINLFERNSGFSFPVFEFGGEKVLQEDGELLIAPEETLNSLFFYELEKTSCRELMFNPKETYYSIFAYNSGKSYLLFKDNNLSDLEQLLIKDILTKSEKYEINQFLIDGEICNLNSRIQDDESKNDINGILDFPGKDDVINCQNYAMNYTLSFDPNVYEFFRFKKDELSKMLKDQNNYAFVLFTLLRFQTLSIADLDYLDLIELQKFNFKDKKVHLAIFLLAFENDYFRIIHQYFMEDLNKLAHYNRSTLRLVLEYFNNQITKQDPYISIYIDKLCCFLENWYGSVYVKGEITINGYDYGLKAIKNNLPKSFNVLMRKSIDGLLLEFKSNDKGYYKHMEKLSEPQETVISCYEG